MRRRSPKYFVNWTEHQVLRDYDPEKLKLIGAIAMEWNFVEDMIDHCLIVTLRLPFELETDVTSRINGLDGKFEIIKKGARNHLILREAEAAIVCATISAIGALKQCRDDVVHARVSDPRVDVAVTHPRKGSAYNILFSTSTLRIVFSHLNALSDEIVAAYRLLEPIMYDQGDFDDNPALDPNAIRASPSFQDALALLQERQTHRLSLPEIPKFPEEPPIRPGSEAPQAPPA